MADWTQTDETDEVGLCEDAEVQLSITDKEITIRAPKPRYKLSELLAGIKEDRSKLIEDGSSLGHEEW